MTPLVPIYKWVAHLQIPEVIEQLLKSPVLQKCPAQDQNKTHNPGKNKERPSSKRMEIDDQKKKKTIPATYLAKKNSPVFSLKCLNTPWPLKQYLVYNKFILQDSLFLGTH